LLEVEPGRLGRAREDAALDRGLVPALAEHAAVRDHERFARSRRRRIAARSSSGVSPSRCSAGTPAATKRCAIDFECSTTHANATVRTPKACSFQCSTMSPTSSARSHGAASAVGLVVAAAHLHAREVGAGDSRAPDRGLDEEPLVRPEAAALRSTTRSSKSSSSPFRRRGTASRSGRARRRRGSARRDRRSSATARGAPRR
jgi:Tfp pilus assembly protein PilX